MFVLWSQGSDTAGRALAMSIGNDIHIIKISLGQSPKVSETSATCDNNKEDG